LSLKLPTRLNLPILALLLVTSFAIYNPTPTYADNANPPKIILVDQITSGPYTVGDIVSFRVNYTGGNPGIKLISIRVGGSNNTCIIQSANLFALPQLSNLFSITDLKWEKGKSIESPFSNNKVVSGFVVPCIDDQRLPGSVSIVDETDLNHQIGGFMEPRISSLDFEVLPTDLITPKGEIKPIKMNDSASIKSIPKTPRVGSKYELPRITKGGAPIYWKVNGNCVIEHKTFLGDIGGTLQFKKSGRCELLPTVMPTDKFREPKYSANVKMQEFREDNILTIVGVFNSRK
jgi:hypothetical protein